MGRPSYIQLGQGDEDDDDFDVEVGGGGGEGGEEDHVQVIWMDGEGRLEGYRQTRLRRMVFILLNVVTFGVPWLIIAALRPKLLLTLEGKRVELRRSEKVLLTTFGQNNEVQDEAICPVVWTRNRVDDGGGGGGGRRRPSPMEEYQHDSHLTKHDDDSTTHLLPESGRTPPPNDRYFIHRHHKWVWDEGEGHFRRLEGLERLTCNEILTRYGEGLSGEGEREAGRSLHGPNSMEVEVKSWPSLLKEEVLNPFYIFQLGSVILWCLDDYTYYASCVLVISALSIGIALVETRRQAEMVRRMAATSEVGSVRVRMRGHEGGVLVSSKDLVPGDVLLIPREGCVLPCDAVLTGGSCLVNEGLLTGESTPVQKSALLAVDDVWGEEKHRRHTLFGGTEVLQTRYYLGASVTAVVVRTGFNTAKGELIHSILFPKPLGFQFYADALKFVGVLFILASIGMTYCVWIYVERGASWSVTLLRVLDILTIVVPPALPAAMTVGTVYAQARLKRASIFCTSPPRINFCGKLGLICFDKTGTLTEEGLDMWGVVPVTGKEPCVQFCDPLHHPNSLGDESDLLRAMAACHSLTHIHGRLVGDPLDLKMFEGTGWELEEPIASGVEETCKFDVLTPTIVKSGRRRSIELGILRELEFTPQLQRMSVIVRSSSSSEMVLYCKGAPEQIRALCLASTIPTNYDDTLDSYTVRGYRVLGLGMRPLRNLKWHQLQRAPRPGLEENLTFLGFLVMQNSVKGASMGVIRELTAARLRSVMVTGDNMLTAVSVARECGIVGEGVRVVVVGVGDDGAVTFRGEGRKGDEGDEGEGDDEGGGGGGGNYVFVLGGGTWSALVEQGEDKVLDRIVAKGAVYARMSPENKSQLVERLQGIGYVVGMCGDGANDCSALKTAHVGISLSEAEASVAAPFTSKVGDISCVPKLIREGRCALVTSFGIFKYMALYSMVQFSSVLILYRHKTNLADTQFLWVDLGITTSIAIVMGRTEPAATLVPDRPSASLVSLRNIFSILAQVVVAAGVQAFAMELLEREVWFHALTPPSADQLITLCWETTTIFSVSSFQYLILAVVFSKGPPFRKPFYMNGAFVAVVLVLGLVTLILAAHPPSFLSSFFHLMPVGGSGDSPTDKFRLRLLILPVFNLTLSLFLEGSWVQGGVKRLGHCLGGKNKKKSAYKRILYELEMDVAWPPLTTEGKSKTRNGSANGDTTTVNLVG